MFKEKSVMEENKNNLRYFLRNFSYCLLLHFFIFPSRSLLYNSKRMCIYVCYVYNQSLNKICRSWSKWQQHISASAVREWILLLSPVFYFSFSTEIVSSRKFSKCQSGIKGTTYFQSMGWGLAWSIKLGTSRP